MGKFKAFLYLLLTIISYVILAFLGALIIDYIVKFFSFNSLVCAMFILAYLLILDPILVYLFMNRLPFKAKGLKTMDLEDLQYPDESVK